MSDVVIQAIVGGGCGVIVALIGSIRDVVLKMLENRKSEENPSAKLPDREEEEAVTEKMGFMRTKTLIWIIAPFTGALIAFVVFLGGFNAVRAVAGPGPATPQAVATPGLAVLRVPVSITEKFYPSGFMGDFTQISLNDEWTSNCHAGPTCVMVKYSPAYKPEDLGWAGVYWQYPDKNWGDQPGRKVEGAKKLVFWARGELGGEVLKFGTGGMHDKQYKDSLDESLGKVQLTAQWQEFQINLAGADMSSVIGAFYWSAGRNGNPKGATFYLDEIYFR